MTETPDEPLRKSVTLSAIVWARVEDYRFNNRIATQAEALRRIIVAGLDALRGSTP